MQYLSVIFKKTCIKEGSLPKYTKYICNQPIFVLLHFFFYRFFSVQMFAICDWWSASWPYSSWYLAEFKILHWYFPLGNEFFPICDSFEKSWGCFWKEQAICCFHDKTERQEYIYDIKRMEKWGRQKIYIYFDHLNLFHSFSTRFDYLLNPNQW